MKLLIKRIYCPKCQRLVRGREQREGRFDRTHILCSRCGKLLYIWNGITWRFVREGA